MTWTFQVTAKDERKLYSRLFLVLEQQRVAIGLFHAEAGEGQVRVTFVISSEEDKAYRIESLLYRLQDVCSIFICSVP
jgi:hypothetical protein